MVQKLHVSDVDARPAGFLLRFVEVLGEGAYVCEREARISGELAGYEILKLGKSRDIDLIERVRCGRLLR